MRILGVDFTSRPTRAKPITCLRCSLSGDALRAEQLEKFSTFAEFEEMLNAPGPWLAGIDFPFGQSRRFIETIGWPQTWVGYVAHAKSLGREGFRETLVSYCAKRLPGDKEHKRETDLAAGSISPQKLYGVPVGLMFFEGAPRLIEADVSIPHVRSGDPVRIVVEAYPGVLARRLLGKRRGYKSDTKRKQTADQGVARHLMLDRILEGALADTIDFSIRAPRGLADDPTGDQLDALLCAIQGAWAWSQRHAGYGAAEPVDSLEGWIADPGLRSKSQA